MQFAFIDNTGQVMAVQSSPFPPETTAWESVEGYSRVELDDSVEVTRDHKIVDGVPVPSPNPVQPEDFLDYREKRALAYSPIGDQLDMQYHDSVNGTTTWVDHVAAVKAKYPKP